MHVEEHTIWHAEQRECEVTRRKCIVLCPGIQSETRRPVLLVSCVLVSEDEDVDAKNELDSKMSVKLVDAAGQSNIRSSHGSNYFS